LVILGVTCSKLDQRPVLVVGMAVREDRVGVEVG
jgi:hypothetical protein